MTIARVLPWLAAGLVCIALVPPAAAGEPAPPARAARNGEATKARQAADRERLIAKLREEAPKTHDEPPKTSVLELPIFHRHDRP